MSPNYACLLCDAQIKAKDAKMSTMELAKGHLKSFNHKQKYVVSPRQIFWLWSCAHKKNQNCSWLLSSVNSSPSCLIDFSEVIRQARTGKQSIATCHPLSAPPSRTRREAALPESTSWSGGSRPDTDSIGSSWLLGQSSSRKRAPKLKGPLKDLHTISKKSITVDSNFV